MLVVFSSHCLRQPNMCLKIFKPNKCHTLVCYTPCMGLTYEYLPSWHILPCLHPFVDMCSLDPRPSIRRATKGLRLRQEKHENARCIFVDCPFHRFSRHQNTYIYIAQSWLFSYYCEWKLWKVPHWRNLDAFIFILFILFACVKINNAHRIELVNKADADIEKTKIKLLLLGPSTFS